MGTTCGPGMATEACITRLAERGVSGLSPSLFLDSIISMPAGFISICLGIDGSIAVVNGTHPLDVARWWLATGREDTVILLATETYSPVFLRAISGFRKTDYHGYQQPTLAQASAALVIETRARVEERGAHCVARL